MYPIPTFPVSSSKKSISFPASLYILRSPSAAVNCMVFPPSYASCNVLPLPSAAHVPALFLNSKVPALSLNPYPGSPSVAPQFRYPEAAIPMFPFTSRVCAGEVVPIPTVPLTSRPFVGAVLTPAYAPRTIAPATSSLLRGAVVPIPTSPESNIPKFA